MKIPIIIPVFNQPTYLKNIINWWRWYHPDKDNNPIYVVDNGSNYQPILDLYDDGFMDVEVYKYTENKFIPNLKHFINNNIKGKYDYYVISDPDIMPHPSTPPNFLEIFRSYIEQGYHRAGFGLITDGLPDWMHKRDWIAGDEKALLNNPVVKYGNFIGYKAPIDTTFCMYSSNNGGWCAPMKGNDWGNCIRIFEAFHLTWYIDEKYINPEMDNYFKTAKYRVVGEPSAGKNNSRPKKYINE